MLGSEGAHKASVIGAYRDPASVVTEAEFEAFRRIVDFGNPAGRRVVLFKERGPLINAVEDIGLPEAELGLRSPGQLRRVDGIDLKGRALGVRKDPPEVVT